MHPETNRQFLILRVQLGKSIEELHAIGTGKHTQFEGGGVGKESIIVTNALNDVHKFLRVRSVRVSLNAEKQLRKSLADTLDSNVVKLKATNAV